MPAIPLSRPPVDDEIKHAVLIHTGVHYPVPTHLQPAVAPHGSSRLPETERLVDEILTLPISSGHTVAEIDTVAAAVREFFGV